MLTDAVRGSSGGVLRLEQNAFGGIGGGSEDGFGATGGLATSHLTLSDSTAVWFVATTVGAYGGSGGQGSGSASAGAGGAAEAVLALLSTSTGAGGSVIAVGGAGGDSAAGGHGMGGDARARGAVESTVGADSAVSARGGAGYLGLADGGRADVVSRATSAGAAVAKGEAYGGTGNVLGRASSLVEARSTTAFGSSLATAEATGLQADATARSMAQGAASNYAYATSMGEYGAANSLSNSTGVGGVTVQTQAGAPAGGTVRTATSTNVGGNSYGMMGPASGYQALSYALAAPTAGTLGDVLADAPAVAAALADSQVMGIGTMASSFGADGVWGTPYSYITTANFVFATGVAGHLTLGLLGSVSEAAGFTELELIVRSHGTEVFSQTFTTVAEAQSFFNDRALVLGMLGAGNQDLLVSAGFTLTEPGGFGFEYAVGVAPIPEPGTWMLLLAGLTVVLLRRRSSREPS
ncbi:PEP-CTERM sorting domain-containing protein [Pseudoduganella chitinolytica]|uniref:PEP-CTERM sorting domain-containing protein n=1 Tax=Pseudoduganella chitinolytica TaxID=34070 RepID=A0ABY8B8T2_9BURK|nr:PEP-CTERM sorting domain-containing protein [Pseudoduganella chitinolytica]WEF32340.1 PEP-CTERM sorting domain-containing protein [Pseudoduganella chitinolytica]